MDDAVETANGHLRRDHIHQHAARIGRLAARHIDTGYGERQDPLSENAAVRLRVDPAVAERNIFVALAKKACFGYVSIDSIAGPSEILVIADETANPRYVAADLLSQ